MDPGKQVCRYYQNRVGNKPAEEGSFRVLQGQNPILLPKNDALPGIWVHRSMAVSTFFSLISRLFLTARFSTKQAAPDNIRFPMITAPRPKNQPHVAVSQQCFWGAWSLRLCRQSPVTGSLGDPMPPHQTHNCFLIAYVNVPHFSSSSSKYFTIPDCRPIASSIYHANSRIQSGSAQTVVFSAQTAKAPFFRKKRPKILHKSPVYCLFILPFPVPGH